MDHGCFSSIVISRRIAFGTRNGQQARWSKIIAVALAGTRKKPYVSGDFGWGVAKWPKAPVFGTGIRRFESSRPSQISLFAEFPPALPPERDASEAVSSNKLKDGKLKP